MQPKMEKLGLGWVDAEYGEIPSQAVQGGVEADGSPLYIGRGEYKRGVQVGKVSREHGGLLIGYGGREIKLKHYQVLCGDAQQLRWVECEGKEQPMGWTLVQGGREADGSPLYIARIHHNGGRHVGKAGQHLKYGASCSFGSEEIDTANYSILAYQLGV